MPTKLINIRNFLIVDIKLSFYIVFPFIIPMICRVRPPLFARDGRGGILMDRLRDVDIDDMPADAKPV